MFSTARSASSGEHPQYHSIRGRRAAAHTLKSGRFCQGTACFCLMGPPELHYIDNFSPPRREVKPPCNTLSKRTAKVQTLCIKMILYALQCSRARLATYMEVQPRLCSLPRQR